MVGIDGQFTEGLTRIGYTPVSLLFSMHVPVVIPVYSNMYRVFYA